MKILTVIGARPQFIKSAMVSKSIAQHNLTNTDKQIQEVIVHTGQHYNTNMSDIFFSEMDICPPDYNLGIGGLSHGAMTGKMLEEIEKIILTETPDLVMVYGDTNSTLAGALAAAKLKVKVAHVEAGLRSFNIEMPEEINRILTDRISDLLFVPTESAMNHLYQEGIAKRKIHLVGDVMYDAALHYGEKAESKSKILEQLGLAKQKYILATIHRAENTDNPTRLGTIFSALTEVAEQISIVLPLHPRTRKALIQEEILEKVASRLQIIDPVGYLDMIALEKNASVIVTDSGGVQKEAFFYQIPCITLRDETEWIELVKSGWNKVVPPLTANSIKESILNTIFQKLSPPVTGSFYGGGQASMAIVKILQEV
jgi:UDP-GlcNAc3NAcA epimerase